METTQKQQTRHLSLSRTVHWEMWQVSLIRSGRANWESWEEVATRIEKAGTVYQIWRCRSERKRTPGGTELKWVDLLYTHLAEIPNLQTYMTEIHGDHTSTKPRVSTCHQILPNVLNEQGVKRMRRCVCVCVCVRACVRACGSLPWSTQEGEKRPGPAGAGTQCGNTSHPIYGPGRMQRLHRQQKLPPPLSYYLHTPTYLQQLRMDGVLASNSERVHRKTAMVTCLV